MDEGWLGEIRGFAGGFAPRNWMYCQGQTLAIGSYQALFSLLGNTFGGSYPNTFALPNLAGRTPIGSGQSTASGNNFVLGAFAGTEIHALTMAELPMHNHVAQTSGGTAKLSGSATATMNVNNEEADGKSPSGKYLSVSSGPDLYAGSPTAGATLNNEAISVNTSGLSVNVSGISIQIETAGVSAPVSLMQPYLVINWIICISGYYPTRD